MTKEDIDQKTVGLMMKYYCQAHHNSKFPNLCSECLTLLEYAFKKLSKCPQKPNKPTCSNCKIHCYEPKQRENIKSIMKYAGPIILFKHPILGLKYLYKKIFVKPKVKFDKFAR